MQTGLETNRLFVGPIQKRHASPRKNQDVIGCRVGCGVNDVLTLWRVLLLFKRKMGKRGPRAGDAVDVHIVEGVNLSYHETSPSIGTSLAPARRKTQAACTAT